MPLRTKLSDRVSKLLRRLALGVVICGLFAAAAIHFGNGFVPVASAVGEERTLSFYNIHTKETITVTFKRDGRYIPSAMDELNWFLRDWRRNEETQMDPELIDLIWELAEELRVEEPIEVISGYRSHATNQALRRAGRRVARRSMHIQGQAADVYFPGVPLERLRNSALVREVGGVGYYPRSGQNGFVHVDTGRVRHWPRIGQQQIARIFQEHREQLEQEQQERSGPILLAGGDVNTTSPENQNFPLPDEKPGDVENSDPAATQEQQAPSINEPIVVASNQNQSGENIDQSSTQQQAGQAQAPAGNVALASVASDQGGASEAPGQRNLMFFPLAILQHNGQNPSGLIQTASYQPSDDGTFQEVIMMRGSVDDLTEEEQALLASFELSAQQDRGFTSHDIQRIASQIVIQSSKGSLQMSEHDQGPAIANGRAGRLDAPETIIDLIGGTEEVVSPQPEAEVPAPLRLGLEDAVSAPGDADGEQPLSVMVGTLQ